MLPQSAVKGRTVWRARRFWEATTGICYRTLQFAESQARWVEICLNCCTLDSAEPHLHVLRVGLRLFWLAFLHGIVCCIKLQLWTMDRLRTQCTAFV